MVSYECKKDKSVLKLYGERNTGTNYLTKLIDLNLDIEQLHGVVPSYIMRLQHHFIGDEWVRAGQTGLN